MKTAALIVVLLLSAIVQANNPCISTAYTADPSGHIFNGRLYVYCSHDRTDAKYLDQTDYHVFSTDDLQNWSDHGVALDLRHVPWANSHLWGPDCNFSNGTYYFVFPAAPKGNETGAIGIATGASPEGPFSAEPHPLPNMQGVDPSLFIDEDGAAYMVWAGSNTNHIVKMKPNLLDPDGPYLNVQGCEDYSNGPWLFKRSGTYYMTYSAYAPRQGPPGAYLDYATSKSVLGPYQYQGHITSSGPKKPGGMHGSQFEWNGKWYCLYHDSSISEGQKNRDSKRGFRIDEMQFAPDGRITELKWTDTGPPQLKPLDAFATHDATCLNQTPYPEDPLAVTIEPNPDGGMELANLRNGAWVRYAGVDFGAGATHFMALIRTSAGAASEIELHLDSLDGRPIGCCHIPGLTNGWQSASCPVANVGGSHFLYLKFVGPWGGELFKLASFKFTR